MLFTSRKVRIGKNCAQGLGYRPKRWDLWNTARSRIEKKVTTYMQDTQINLHLVMKIA